MITKVLSAGDYIASRCSKCKDTTNHTIIAMVGEKVVRVECNTCGSHHNYRGEVKKKAPARRSTASAKPRSIGKAAREWEQLQEQMQPELAIPYSMNTPVKVDMLIQHPNFGLGLVVNCIRPNKMEVRFESGLKMLRCKID